MAQLESSTQPVQDAVVSEPQPMLFHRWLGAVPMLMTFVVAAGIARAMDVMEYVNRIQLMGVELAKPTCAAIFLCQAMQHYYGLGLPAMFGLCWLHFGWAAKRQKRLMWFNILAVLVCVLTALILIGGLFLPYMQIQEALKRK
jgi:hypothetical protein